ncbi:PHB depolymerase family esterase [Polymorphospora sp. NPDC051019]|uniref:extracellular catalytic domain type 2 short-chain-length polyhydroxyalkanoate depolymerase n=1 Tax=Polymorphospora sp. NPDC051019 TaxID=3155725 RepID=UPI0034287509
MKFLVRAITAAATAALLTVVPTTAAQAADPPTRPPVPGSLNTYNVSAVYVAGVSAGGYMATQLHLAYSARIRGAAIFAAGPYYCAQFNAAQATYGCMDDLWPTNLAALKTYPPLWAAYGWIDPVTNLSGRPVYAFRGTGDTVVKKPVNDALVNFYQHFGASVQYDTGSPAGHGWVTPYGTVGCSATAQPYLNDCGTDPQNAFLRKLLGSVSPRNTGALGGQLISFNQSSFAVNGYAPGLSMGSTGFAYVPASCAAGQSCRLLVALHGCKQGHAEVGTAFVDRANLNQYADTNRLIVLYPQAVPSAVNPNGCWDWWGYLGATNYAIKGGAQLETIMNMVRRLDG